MLRICSLIVLALGLGFAAQAEELAGRVSFSDADTLTVGATKVRLFGIDAPEADQLCQRSDGVRWRCGTWATEVAREQFDGRTARCTVLDIDRYGRKVSKCRVGDRDIADTLVRLGAAQAYRKYSLDYIDAEKEAAITSRGIWSGTLEDPSAHRAAKQPVPQVAEGDCAIKGNISRSGSIYHLPGQKFYDETRISPARGERWFCTEAEAIAAGWRRARQ